MIVQYHFENIPIHFHRGMECHDCLDGSPVFNEPHIPTEAQLVETVGGGIGGIGLEEGNEFGFVGYGKSPGPRPICFLSAHS
jgi:hypothetical protein